MSENPASENQRAFLLAPEPSRYFPAGAIEEARLRITRCVLRSEGAALVIGGAGMGKSLLLEVLAEEFRKQMSVVQLIGAQLCTRRALLQMILFELGLPFRDMDEGELRLALHEHLKPADEHPRRLLLLVDEADSLPIRLLEEIRALTNLAAHGSPLVCVVLAGRAILEERFADPKLEVFAQRLATRCYLSALSREETFSYVRSQLSAIGEDPNALFADDALDALHGAADGVPRLINQLGDQLMWLVEETGCQPLDAELVQQAWSNLQQLPAPWETQSAAESSDNVIEFGELDEEESYVMEYVVDKLVDETPPDLDAFSEYDDEDEEAEHDEHEAAEPVDDMPASISIDVARSGCEDPTLQEIADSFEVAEELVSQLGDAEPLESQIVSTEVSEQVEEQQLQPASAADPFAESFDDEEIVLDHYVAFESSVLAAQQQVMNFDDQALAGDLEEIQFAPKSRANCDLEVVATEANGSDQEMLVQQPNSPAAGGPTDPEESASVIDADSNQTSSDEQAGKTVESEASTSPISLPANRSPELIVVEDDDSPAAEIVTGRNFRRLFSSLETAQPLQQLGSR